MAKQTIRLSWPNKILSSNSRTHWAPIADAKRAYRNEAWAVMLDANVKGNTLEFTYHPPDKRKRDAQNVPHMLKSAIDGIADGMRVDDNSFRCIFPSTFAEPVKGGCVVVEISNG